MIRFSPLCLVAFGARRSCRRAAGIAAAGLVCALPSLAIAVGLGPVTQQSGLGQTLRILVPVTLGEGEDVPAECFRIAPGQGAADGIPDLLFGRVIAERTASGTTLVVTSPRPVHDPVVRITIQAGCETSVRREYTLFMDPPAIEVPVVAAAERPPAREVLGLPPPPPAGREVRRPPRPQARTATRSAQGGSAAPAAIEAPAKGSAPKGSVTARQASRPPPAPTAAARPRLEVASGAPGTLPGALATEADRERARQERANAIEAETQVLRQRIVELTAMVEKMQRELRAQELAEQAAAAQAAKPTEASKAPADASKALVDAAKAPDASPKPPDAAASGVGAEAAKATAQDTAPAVEAVKPPAADTAKPAEAPAKAETPAPVPSWWELNALLIAAIIGLPLVIAALLLWKRRRDASQDDQWRTAAIPLSRSSSQLRGATAGVVMPGRTFPPAMSREVASPAAPRDAVDALAVSELSHVTEEARVFMALGHNDRAIEVLQDHIRRLPRSMPAAWLMLFDLYHRQGNRAEFRKLADTFHTHFNVRAPLWEEYTGENSLTGGIESFPAIERQVAALWRRPECRAYLEGLLYDNREGRRNGFPLATYSDILLLLQVLDAPPEVDIDEDLVAAGKLEGRPKAKTATDTAAKKPMPPDPAARPAQQPIRFEIEPQESGERKRN
jgi:hypothetical protein